MKLNPKEKKISIKLKKTKQKIPEIMTKKLIIKFKNLLQKKNNNFDFQ